MKYSFMRLLGINSSGIMSLSLYMYSVGDITQYICAAEGMQHASKGGREKKKNIYMFVAINTRYESQNLIPG